MNNEKLLEKNLAFFSESFPSVAYVANKHPNPYSKIVMERDHAINIDLGTGPLYNLPADEAANLQIHEFMQNPERIVLNGPEGAYLSSGMSVWALKFMQEFLAVEKKVKEVAGNPAGYVGYLIIVGIGLGRHLEELVDKTDARHVIISEPVGEFLRHSLSVVSWQNLIKKWEKNGRTVDFVVGDNPDKVVDDIIEVVRGYGIPLIDGSYFFTHYNSALNHQILFKFREKIPFEVVSRGFFEDEVIMIENAAGNLIYNDFNFLDGVPLMQRAEPAFIVASGPSIDRSIETIKEWQDRAIIFSSGSSLQILLHHGIIPDYHVELENVPAVVDMLEHILELNKDKFPNSKFDGIKLIASITVNSNVPPMFEDSYLFFRDSVSSSYVFGAEFRVLKGIAPNVSNTSLGVAAILGFHNIYFFGADCGYRSRNYHHSKNTAYYTSEEFGGGRGSTEMEKPFAYTYPGNFGGVVHTDLLLDWNRQLLEQMLRIYRINAFNCSDGVKIEGAKPLVAKACKIESQILDKSNLINGITKALPMLRAGTFFETHEMIKHISEIKQLYAEYIEFMDDAISNCDDFEPFYKNLMDFLEEKEKEYSGVQRLIAGSASAIPKIAIFYVNRLKNEEDRDDALAAFLSEFKKIIDEMFKQTFDLFIKISSEDLKIFIEPNLLEWKH